MKTQSSMLVILVPLLIAALVAGVVIFMRTNADTTTIPTSGMETYVESDSADRDVRPTGTAPVPTSGNPVTSDLETELMNTEDDAGQKEFDSLESEANKL